MVKSDMKKTKNMSVVKKTWRRRAGVLQIAGHMLEKLRVAVCVAVVQQFRQWFAATASAASAAECLEGVAQTQIQIQWR